MSITLQLKDTSVAAVDLDSRVKVFAVKKKDGTEVKYSVQDETLSLSLKDFSESELKEPLTFVISYETTANIIGGGDSSALTSVPERKSDPVKARVAYTTSEPQGASDWMPCHNVPYDRALWSSEFTMDQDEKLISNGALVDDHLVGNRHIMRYQTAYTIPPYLMAFGVGQFEIVSDGAPGLPVSVWHRRGLPGAHREVVGQLREMIQTYEKLVGPYPFEKYSLVLLPEFPAGGLENVSITFQAENRSTESQSSADFGLSAHELGHQWFGDYMTVETWDDLWIKEGMAQVLSEEATRAFEDANHSGRFFALDYWASQGDAIRDPALKPDDKYTTG
ncbi:MAG: M1 family aminopeptidase, partial [Verrucomicrobiales bacterium]